MGSAELLNFSSNDYLGLGRYPKVKEASISATARYGTGAGASRLLSGNHPLYAQLESNLAKFKGTEAALVFPTGYMANLGLLTSLAGPGDTLILDKLCHASLIDAARLSGAVVRTYPHRDVERCREILTKSAGRRIVVTDGVFSMDGDLAPLPELVSLTQTEGAALVVDDAHGNFLLGEDGRGTLSHFGISDPAGGDSRGGVIQMGTFSKALGSLGGYVVGSTRLIDFLINKARSFIFTTGLPPGVVAASLAALEIVEKEPDRRRTLLARAAKFRAALTGQGWDILGSQTQIIPILAGQVEAAIEWSGHLRASGIFAPAIRPPTVPPGKCRIRISLTAYHDDPDVERLLSALGGILHAAR